MVIEGLNASDYLNSTNSEVESVGESTNLLPSLQFPNLNILTSSPKTYGKVPTWSNSSQTWPPIKRGREIFGTAQSGHLDTQFPQFWNADLNKQAKQIAQQLVLLPKPQPQQLLVSLNPNLAKTTSPN